MHDQSLQDALMVLDPLPDCSSELTDLVTRIVSSTDAGEISSDSASSVSLRDFVLGRIDVRPETEHEGLKRLAEHV